MRHSPIIWLAVAVHASQGISCLFDPSSLGATPMAPLALIGPRWAGLLLIAVAAAAAHHLRRRPSGLLALALGVGPQQGIILVTGWSALLAITSSSYADHVIRPRGFIFSDQNAWVWVAVFHTAAVLHAFSHNGSARE